MPAMDAQGKGWYFSDMERGATAIPAFGLYGESGLFPDILHCERIVDRAALHGWAIDPHRHANLHQFFFIGAGGATVTVDGTVIPVTAPVCLSVPRYVVHAFRFPQGQQGYVLSIPPDMMPELFGAGAERPAAFSTPLCAPAGDDLAARFETILEELADTRVLRAARLRAQVTEIAVAVLRDGDGGAGRGAPGPSERHMRAFERLVRRHLREHLRVSDYAAALGLGPDHLGRICRAMTGLTAAAFLDARVMQEARRQLAYTTNPVSQIAYGLGYSDPAYFSRAFRRSHGLSPSRYRAERGDPSA